MWKVMTSVLTYALVVLLSVVGTVIALTVLDVLEFNGVVVKAPQEAKIYTAPSGGMEITGPVHMGNLPRGVDTTTTWFIVNEGVEPITPTVRVEGSNINCPSCDFTSYGEVVGTPTMSAGEWSMIRFVVYPSPDTPEDTPFNATYYIETE